MNYEPKPVDTSDISLPEELLALTERIAENVHDKIEANIQKVKHIMVHVNPWEPK